MAKSAEARAEASFKQLCCLGLGGEAVIPALLIELRALVPFVRATVFFLDESGALASSYGDVADSTRTGELYMQEFHGRRGRELGGAFPDAIRNQVGVHDHVDALSPHGIDMKTFRRSDFYNLIYRPLRQDWFMRLVVREGGRGRALGSLTIYRSPGERPWTSLEKRRFGDLEPFFAHALKDHDNTDAPLVDSGRSGLIVADQEGRPVYFSSEGRRLLYLAVHPRITPDTAFNRLTILPPALVQMCRNLSRIFSNDAAFCPGASTSELSPSAPTYQHRNVWGGFSFAAHWLEGSGPASDLIGITVSHEEPLPIKLMRRLKELPLSGRQGQVCFLMANGASNERIAEQLGISRHTAIAHGRWIYNKLDVHNRTELVNKLLFGAGPSH